jgi:hypothetical protein
MTPMCSINFRFSGTCDGTEKVSPLHYPWLTVPIDIVGVTLVLQVSSGSGPVEGYALAGNAYDPDIMG